MLIRQHCNNINQCSVLDSDNISKDKEDKNVIAMLKEKKKIKQNNSKCNANHIKVEVLEELIKNHIEHERSDTEDAKREDHELEKNRQMK